MTEVPEHLLRRAKERRAALSGDAAPEDASASAPEAAATPAASAPVPAAAAAAAPVPAAPAAPVVVPEAPVYIAGRAANRTKVPAWVLPVLLVLPFWGVLYAGAFGDRTKHEAVDPLVLGQQVYARAGCSSCHGAQGEGGVGPALRDGDAVKTFPDEADHIDWVKTGSAPFRGKKYGDPNREGGQRGPATGGMPAFTGTLSDEEIAAVVKYEREQL